MFHPSRIHFTVKHHSDLDVVYEKLHDRLVLILVAA